MQPIVPFSPKIVALEESWQRMEPVDGQKTAATINELVKEIATAHAKVDKGIKIEKNRCQPEQ